MLRDEEEKATARADAAKRRLRQGLQASRSTLAQYRTRLLLLRAAGREVPATAAGPSISKRRPR